MKNFKQVYFDLKLLYEMIIKNKVITQSNHPFTTNNTTCTANCPLNSSDTILVLNPKLYKNHMITGLSRCNTCVYNAQ